MATKPRLIAGVEYVTPAISVSAQTPRASVEYQREGEVGKTYIIPVTDVSWISIIFDAEVDPIGRNPVVFDITLVGDAATLLVGKNVSEAQYAVDQLQSFQIGKNLADPVDTLDAKQVDLTKPESDDVLTADPHAIAFNKPLAPEQQYVADAVVLGYGKFKHESVSHTDGPNGEQTYAEAGYFAETYSLNYFPKFDFNKNVAEALATATSVPLFDFGKAPSDLAVTLDTTAFDFVTSRAEAFLASDAYASLFETSRSDSFTQSDAALILFGKNPADTAGTSDQGSLHMTDYADISYFAEAYVGTSLTF